MTKDELELVRLRSRVQALETVLAMICSGLAHASPTFLQSFLQTGNPLRENHRNIALKDRPPEQSDQIAAEYQEALDSLLKFIESLLK